jgi:hypothetical protein
MENTYFAFYPRDHDVSVVEENQFYGGLDQFCEQFGPNCDLCRDSNYENRITIIANDRPKFKNCFV